MKKIIRLLSKLYCCGKFIRRFGARILTYVYVHCGSALRSFSNFPHSSEFGKKSIIGITLFCVFIFNAQAGSTLENKITVIPEGGVLTADFIQQRHLTGIPKPIISTGKIMIWKSRGLIWNTKTPFASVVLITSGGLYQVEGGQKIAMIKAAQTGGDRTIFDTLGNVLAGDFSKGVTGFEVKTLSSQENQWHIQLVPVYSEIKNFITAIDVLGKKQISRVVVSRPNGDKDVIDIKDHLLFDSASINKAISTKEQAWFNE